MKPDVSRALAAFVSSLGLGQEQARALADEYGSAASAADLPEWLLEVESDGG